MTTMMNTTYLLAIVESMRRSNIIKFTLTLSRLWFLCLNGPGWEGGGGGTIDTKSWQQENLN